MDEEEVGRSRVRSRLPVIHKGLMSISNRLPLLGGKGFGISCYAKKTRFDPNSIDLLLSMDTTERAGGGRKPLHSCAILNAADVVV